MVPLQKFTELHQAAKKGYDYALPGSSSIAKAVLLLTSYKVVFLHMTLWWG